MPVESLSTAVGNEAELAIEALNMLDTTIILDVINAGHVLDVAPAVDATAVINEADVVGTVNVADARLISLLLSNPSLYISYCPVDMRHRLMDNVGLAK